MNSKVLIIFGVLIIAAAFSLFTNKSPETNQEFLQTPTPTTMPINFQNNTNILGEEAQNPPTTQEPSQTISNATKASIVTTKGEIEIVLFSDAAPKTVENFVNKALSNFYSNLTFHRVEDWVVQGGDPLGNGTGGGQMETELNNNPFIRGSVGVARGGNIQISNASQFFITKTDAPHLDSLYTNFGQVSNGLDIVDSLEIGDRIISISVE